MHDDAYWKKSEHHEYNTVYDGAKPKREIQLRLNSIVCEYTAAKAAFKVCEDARPIIRERLYELLGDLINTKKPLHIDIEGTGLQISIRPPYTYKRIDTNDLMNFIKQNYPNIKHENCTISQLSYKTTYTKPSIQILRNSSIRISDKFIEDNNKLSTFTAAYYDFGLNEKTRMDVAKTELNNAVSEYAALYGGLPQPIHTATNYNGRTINTRICITIINNIRLEKIINFLQSEGYTENETTNIIEKFRTKKIVISTPIATIINPSEYERQTDIDNAEANSDIPL